MCSSPVIGGATWRDLLPAALDACAAVDLAALDDAALAQALGEFAAGARRLEGLGARALAEQQRRRPATNPGEVSRAVKAALGVSGAEARALADTAAALVALPPAAGDALASGAVSGAHLRALQGAGAGLDDGAKADLLDRAAGSDPDLFRRQVQAAAMRADGDDGAARAARQYAARTASWRELDDGMHELRALFAPGDAALVRGALHEVMDRRWRAEHPDREPVRVERATHGARLADALVDLARGAADSGAGSGAGSAGGSAMGVTTAPLVVLLADFDTLARGLHDGSVHEDSWGHVVAPETIRRLACDAGILPLVLDGAGIPLDAGRRRRLPSETQRLAVIARDRHCRFGTCRLPAAWCQVHHIRHWSAGGPTDLDNLLLLCHHHHELFHEGGWRIEGTARAPRFVSPSGAVYAPGSEASVGPTSAPVSMSAAGAGAGAGGRADGAGLGAVTAAASTGGAGADGARLGAAPAGAGRRPTRAGRVPHELRGGSSGGRGSHRGRGRGRQRGGEQVDRARPPPARQRVRSPMPSAQDRARAG